MKITTLATALTLWPFFASADVTISDGWARASILASRPAAAYLTLTSDQSDQLVAITTPIAGNVTIHAVETDNDGVSRMVEVVALDLPSGEPVTLAPGSMHLMLMGLSEKTRRRHRFAVDPDLRIGCPNGNQRSGSRTGRDEAAGATAMKDILLLIALVAGLPAYADHPGDRLDEVMAQKEPAFTAVDLNELPALGLLGPDGEPLDLESLSDQVVVLSFVPSDCGQPCADQQALLGKVRGGVNSSPMLDMVTFLVVTDASDPVPGPIAENVVIARAQEPMENLIDQYRAIVPDPEAPLVHVIARGNRHSGVFAGSAFRHINMILYVNGLTNAH